MKTSFKTSLLLAVFACSNSQIGAQDARMMGQIPSLDLAYLASDAVAIGARTTDAFGVDAIRVDAVLAGQVSGRTLRLAQGARTGLHVRVGRKRSLLFLQQTRVQGRIAYKLCQHPGSLLEVDASREARVRELVAAFGLLRRGAIGTSHAVLGFAERHADTEPTLAAAALRSLARRSDLLVREASSSSMPRLENLVRNAGLPGALRAEAACCLAGVSTRQANEAVLRTLGVSASEGFGLAVAPLLVQLDRQANATRLADLLRRALPGQHGEIVRCLHAMGSAASRRSLATLYADEALRPVLQRSMRSGKSSSRSRIR